MRAASRRDVVVARHPSVSVTGSAQGASRAGVQVHGLRVWLSTCRHARGVHLHLHSW